MYVNSVHSFFWTFCTKQHCFCFCLSFFGQIVTRHYFICFVMKVIHFMTHSQTMAILVRDTVHLEPISLGLGLGWECVCAWRRAVEGNLVQLPCYWEMGGNQRTWRNPMQAWGEQTKFHTDSNLSSRSNWVCLSVCVWICVCINLL